MIIATAVLIALSILFLVFLLLQRQVRTRKIPPGPVGLPLIGNLHQLLAGSAPHSHLWLLSKQYGPLMSLRLGHVTTLVVSSAKMAQQVMKTHDLIFANRPSLLGQRKLSYNGLDLGFAPYGDYQREMKKLSVLHLFSSRRSQSFRPIREQELARMMTKISQSASHCRRVNLSDTLVCFSCSLICKIAFGKRYEEEEEEEEKGDIGRSKFHGLLNEAQAVLAEFYFSDYFPWMGWCLDRLRGLIWRLDKIFNDLDLFYQQVISDHQDPNRPKTDREDIIDTFLRIKDDPSFPFRLTLDHIKAVLMNIFTAGTDPVAVTVIWAMTALMKNPRVMNEVQEELTKLYGEKEFINEDDIQSLVYLKAVVKETLRLYPPTPLLLPKETTRRCVVEGYEIEPKTLVFVNAWAIARDPQTWKDPEQFYPERFLGSSIDYKGQDFEFIPFGSGRRICPAIHMAVLTAELCLANLVHSFHWELPPGIQEWDIDTQVIPGITMHKKNPLTLVAKNKPKNRKY